MAARLDRDTEAVLHGTLDMLVLRALQLEPMHGWGITERIEQWSEEVLSVGDAPAVHRLELQGAQHEHVEGAVENGFGIAIEARGHGDAPSGGRKKD